MNSFGGKEDEQASVCLDECRLAGVTPLTQEGTSKVQTDHLKWGSRAHTICRELSHQLLGCLCVSSLADHAGMTDRFDDFLYPAYEIRLC